MTTLANILDTLKVCLVCSIAKEGIAVVKTAAYCCKGFSNGKRDKRNYTCVISSKKSVMRTD